MYLNKKEKKKDVYESKSGKNLMQNNSLKLHVKTKLTLCHKMLYVLDDRTSCHCCWSYCYLCFLQHMIYVRPGPLQSSYKQLIWILKPEKEWKKTECINSGWKIKGGRIIRSHITMKSDLGQNYLQRNISALNIHFWLRTEFKSMPIIETGFQIFFHREII